MRQGYNALLSANGMPDIYLRVMRVSLPVNILANEEESVSSKFLYTRQIQSDTFVVTVIFDSMAERGEFYTWYTSYANQTIIPSPVGACRLQVPSRDVDLSGTLTSGVALSNTVSDVTWPMDLTFSGSPSNGYTNFASFFYANKNSTDTQYFYPDSEAYLNGAEIPTSSQVQAVMRTHPVRFE